MEIVIFLLILLFSAILHEIAHGSVAEYFGDDTARMAGRITLNPISHIDPYFSILVPLLLFMSGSPVIFGAAKPVPVNFFNLRNPKRDMALVSLAGPLTNFVLAICFAVPIRLGIISPSDPGFQFLLQAVLLNLVLGIFNLLPLPPLDGSKIFASLFSDAIMYKILAWERFGFLLIILFLYLGIINVALVPILNIFSRILLGYPAI